MEILVGHIAVKLCSLAVAVSQTHVVKTDHARPQVHTVSSGVSCIRKIKFQAEIFCIDIAIQIQILEGPVKPGLATDLSCDFRCESSHERLHESYRRTISLKREIQF